MGLSGLVVKKAEEWREMVKDAVEELKGWGEGKDEDEEDDEEEGDEGEEDGDRDSLQEIFGADKLPKGNEELRAQLDVTLKKVKLIVTLFQAIIKRRLKTLPPPPDIDGKVSLRVDELVMKLKDLPDKVDEMASSFYELDGEQAQKVLNALGEGAQRTIECVSRNWQGQTDEFSDWSSKWLNVFDMTGKEG
ncbi:hypothetical protein EV356DRAFT_498873 [Viridothelium virens]|uniref:Uncharacterized protein n=1 Tax=Viridothelium virens TaxID=1048519 RepID=A0A6A6HD38_VIRVR|nr:hypothetical protein EV356DRAFT_498873 [Viridothelium virens]